jgi:hypothetical protein
MSEFPIIMIGLLTMILRRYPILARVISSGTLPIRNGIESAALFCHSQPRDADSRTRRSPKLPQVILEHRKPHIWSCWNENAKAAVHRNVPACSWSRKSKGSTGDHTMQNLWRHKDNEVWAVQYLSIPYVTRPGVSCGHARRIRI